MAPPDFDVFLSHHSSDKPWVIYLKSELVKRGLRVWLDQDEIRPGDRFVEALQEGLQRCHAMALIVSRESLKSRWVQEEYESALAIGNASPTPLRLIPCLLQDAELPPFLATRDWVDFRVPAQFNQKVDELCWGITGRRDGSAAPPAPAPPAPAPPAPMVSDAAIDFLDRAIHNRRADQRRLVLLRAAAPLCGVAAGTLLPAAMTPTVQIGGSALVTGLIGFGITQLRWSALANERRQLAAQRDALDLCRRTPGPVCPDVVDAFNRFVKRSIGVA